ncbi:hypothetical protein [Enterococcus durans]|uniref:hypothetical protein n=1 Tax=Enterococcus durans TaxID=53345 RepID=UPI0021C3596A|nr:hypothetical protein [Enterococcus durans]
MNRKKINYLKVLILWIGSIVLSFFVIVNPKFINMSNEYLQAFLVVLGYLLFCIQYTYNNIPKVFIYLNQLFIYLKNPDVNWSASTKIHTDNIPSNFLDVIFKKIYNQFDTVNRLAQDSRQISMQINNKLVIVRFWEDEDYEGYFAELVFSSQVGYRSTIKNFDDEYILILDIFRNLLVSRQTQYTLKVIFKDSAPFTKLIIENINDKSLEFNMSYQENEVTYHVSNNQIQAVTTDFERIKKFSKDYLLILTTS